MLLALEKVKADPEKSFEDFKTWPLSVEFPNETQKRNEEVYSVRL